MMNDPANVIDLTGPDPPRINPVVNVDDDEVQVVDPPPQKSPVKMMERRAAANGDVEVVGTVNAMQLPHMRPHCTEHPFQSGEHAASNSQTCDLCYCYVCDVPVKDCKHWTLHCNATDKGPRAYYWNSMRRSEQANTTIFEASFTHGKLFKDIFMTVGKLVKKISLECDHNKGMICNARGSKGTTMISFELARTGFETFQCQEKNFLNVDVADVKRVLKHVKTASHGILLRATSSVLTITVKNNNTGEPVSDPVQVSLLKNRYDEYFATSAQSYLGDARIPAAEFKRIVGVLHCKGKNQTFIIEVGASSPTSITFSRPHSPSLSQENSRYTVDGIVRMVNSGGSFEFRADNRLLYELTRPTPLAQHVLLSLSPTHRNPMKVEYVLQNSASGTSLGRFVVYVSTLAEFA